jgi:hypothetical protein
MVMDNTLLSHLSDQPDPRDMHCLDTDMNYHTNIDERSKLLAVPIARRTDGDDCLSVSSKEGLLNVRAIFFLVLWYFFSGCTLFLNKYILSYMKGDPTILGTSLFFGTCHIMWVFCHCRVEGTQAVISTHLHVLCLKLLYGL